MKCNRDEPVVIGMLMTFLLVFCMSQDTMIRDSLVY
jgi:hypothetical protein